MKSRKAFTLVELIIVICIAGILFTLFFGACSKFGSRSEGSRVGTIQKFSKNIGWVTSTWEGDLALRGIGGSQGGKDGQNGGATSVWSFTVEDDAIAGKINAILDSDDPEKVVLMKYREVRFRFTNLAGNTGYVVYEVKIPNSSGGSNKSAAEAND